MFLFVHQVRTLTADVAKAKYLCKMHLVAGMMPFDTLKKTDNFYTLTGKSAETDTSEGVRDTDFCDNIRNTFQI